MTTRGLTPEEEAVRLLTPAEVGILFGVHGKTVVQWARDGLLPYSTTLGGHHRFRRADVEALMAQRREDTTP